MMTMIFNNNNDKILSKVIVNSQKSKVVVAMSGGVDSSVAAALFKKQGFEVEGVFLKLFASDYFRKSEKRAKKITGALGIPFFVLDLRKEFKKKIIDYFIKELQQGRTPNPCVLCNKEIKFGIFLKKLRELKIDFDFIATGHYAKLKTKNKKAKDTSQKGTSSSQARAKVIYKLLKAKDKNKDQSYFLWMLNQKQLRRILFPIGNYKKEEVRNLAEKFKLPVFSSESQEICFIGKDIDGFLRKNFKIKKGDIVNTEGEIIGEHQGLWFYTIGQRKTIGLAGGPYYVLEKNIKKNLLVVTKNEKDLYSKELIVKNVNWISGKEPRLRECYGGQAKFSIKIKAKIRYRHKSAEAILSQNKKEQVPRKREQKSPAEGEARQRRQNYKLKFKNPQRAITPGQSVVFYKGDELLGGGIIKE